LQAVRPSPTSAPATRKPWWGLGDVAAGWVIGVVASITIGGLILAGAGYTNTTDAPMWLLAILQVPLWFGLLGVPVWASRTKGNGVTEDFGFSMRPSDVWRGLGIGVFAQLVLVPLVSWPWLQLLGKSSHELEQSARDLTDKAHGIGVVLLVIIVVVGAPIIEELFFRGLTLRSLERRWGTTAAVLGSALLFGVTHFEFLQLPALVLFGLIAAWLTVHYRRLGPSIWAHVGFNLTTVLILLAQR
jgi:membrane protease YdiL (CAAX protease family)